MTVDYEDERFGDVESAKTKALEEVEETYDGMIDETDRYYQEQIDQTKAWEEEQKRLLQEETDFTIEQIEQQKKQAEDSYKKEQSAAYVDWKKESGQYGAGAERMAASGMTGTGYSESSRVNTYNTYQNRVATARESYNQIVMNYNNGIKEARISNNASLAEITYESQKLQLELALQSLGYRNQLTIEEYDKKHALESEYYGRYLDVLDQLNTENALAEEKRQYEESYALQLKAQEEEIRQWNEEHALRTKEYEEEIRRYNEEIERLRANDEREYAFEIEQLALEREQLAEEKRRYDEEQLLKERELELEFAKLSEEQRQFDTLYSGENGTSEDEDVRIDKPTGGTGTPVTDEDAAGTGKTGKTYQVSTSYYKGDLNPDAKAFGTFSNGYQPKGINGHGEVTKTGKTVEISTRTLDGRNRLVTQNVWQTPDGILWYWEGRQNKYIQLETSSSNTSTGRPTVTSAKKLMNVKQ